MIEIPCPFGPLTYFTHVLILAMTPGDRTTLHMWKGCQGGDLLCLEWPPWN